MTSAREMLLATVRSVMLPVRLTCEPEMSCAQLIARMGEADAALAVVTDADGRVLGVVSERDIVRRVALKAGPDMPVSLVMTTPAMTVQTGERLYGAVARMRRRRLDQVAVVDDAGRLAGQLDIREAMAALASRLMRLLDGLTSDATMDGLRRLKEGQAALAHSLLEDGIAATEVLQVLSEINSQIYRQVIDLALTGMVEDGWGSAPRPFATIVMGSSGRGESLLGPDQDNGFVIADYPDADHNFVDRFFIELATRMTDGLDAVGFPYCNGHVMATNPLWRKTLPQWCRQIDDWGRRRHAVALLYADIFYDFQVAQGDAELGERLRRHALAVARGARDFLLDLSQNESHHVAGLGWFHRFVTDPEEGPHQGKINLKRNGTLPIVEGVRLYALREGVAATATLERLAALTEHGVFSRDEEDYLAGAFSQMIGLLLRQQVADVLSGLKPSAYVAPSALSSREKDMLADSLKAVERLNTKVRADFTGMIL